MLRRAREAEAQRGRDQRLEWGISAEILTLPTATDVNAVRAGPTRIARARRSDAFQLLIGQTSPEGVACERYVKDWCWRMGTMPRVTETGDTRVDEQKDGQAWVLNRIDAARRLEEVHRRVGGASARLLGKLGESIALCEVRVWREVVRQATGESERHAQAAAVRMAAANLREAYDDLDGVTNRRPPIRLWYAADAAEFRATG